MVANLRSISSFRPLGNYKGLHLNFQRRLRSRKLQHVDLRTAGKNMFFLSLFNRHFKKDQKNISPILGRGGVGNGLLRGESLGGDDEEGALRIALFEGLRHVGAVDVGDEVDIGSNAERLQCLRGHQRPEVCVEPRRSLIASGSFHGSFQDVTQVKGSKLKSICGVSVSRK